MYMFQAAKIGKIITAVRGENVQFCQTEYSELPLSVPRRKSMKQPYAASLLLTILMLRQLLRDMHTVLFRCSGLYLMKGVRSALYHSRAFCLLACSIHFLCVQCLSITCGGGEGGRRSFILRKYPSTCQILHLFCNGGQLR